jgi:ATP-dependent Zn protease
LEEIDAIGDVVKQRGGEAQSASSSKPRTPIHDELTLAEILTVLDGTMEIPGRIVVMTSNHPEVLDAALIRPGRIDVHVNFGYAKRELIAEMVASYLDMPDGFPTTRVAELPHEILTPAEVGQVIFSHFDAPRGEVVDVLIHAFANAASAPRRSNAISEEHVAEKIEEKEEPIVDTVTKDIAKEISKEISTENTTEISTENTKKDITEVPRSANSESSFLDDDVRVATATPHENEKDNVVHRPATPPSCPPLAMYAAANECEAPSSSSIADSPNANSTAITGRDVSASPMFTYWPAPPPSDSWHGASLFQGADRRHGLAIQS